MSFSINLQWYKLLKLIVIVLDVFIFTKFRIFNSGLLVYRERQKSGKALKMTKNQIELLSEVIENWQNSNGDIEKISVTTYTDGILVEISGKNNSRYLISEKYVETI